MIPLISEHYAQKDWTQFEFDSAQREQRKRGREFILPVRIDDTCSLAFPTVGSGLMPAREASRRSPSCSPKSAARELRPMLERLARCTPLLSRCLSLMHAEPSNLIATAALPMPMEYSRSYFRRMTGDGCWPGLEKPTSSPCRPIHRTA